MSQTRHLFVYGTLRPAAEMHMGRAMRRRLATESTLLGAATVPGRLANLGRYPGIVEPSDADRHHEGRAVHGEVVTLHAPDRTWLWLDAYEGCDPDNPEASLYRRAIRQAALVEGGLIETWVYVLAHPPANIRVVESGDWLNRE